MDTNITPILLSISFKLNGKIYNFKQFFGPENITKRPDVMSDAVQSAIKQYMLANNLSGQHSNVQITTIG